MKLEVFFVFCLSATTLARPKDEDEDRPYEFGFKIDGQHRHESKDINGIIMGEFGFITADGVYHVTVYATDENGNFKILSMKNIKVGPPLDNSIPKATTTTTTPAPTSPPHGPYVFTTVPSLPVPSCSACSLPKPSGGKPGKLQFQTPAFQNKPLTPNLLSTSGVNPGPSLNDDPRDRPNPAVVIDNGMIKIPGNDPIPIKDKYPNMVDGLPDGITKNDMLDLLYKFNYTIGFHGHHEKGYKNGAKIGGYFVNGRDGISRVVEYIADENGYRAKMKFINLGLSSDGIPKPESEKTFGLQGYEFVWYPVS